MVHLATTWRPGPCNPVLVPMFPEGDSMSVVCMLALSFVFHHKIASPQLRPYAYADNWSCKTTSERAAFLAMQKILNLITTLRMQIDFTKSWAWATSKQFKEFWRNASALLMQPTFQFQIKNNIHDLGCMIHYSCSCSRPNT